MHLVHFNEIYDNVSAAVNETGGLAVLAVFVEVLLLLLSAHIAFMQLAQMRPIATNVTS